MFYKTWLSYEKEAQYESRISNFLSIKLCRHNKCSAFERLLSPSPLNCFMKALIKKIDLYIGLR
jgi:hypothetical protein